MSTELELADGMTAPALWQRVKEKLRAQVGQEHYQAWFTGLQCAGMQGDHLLSWTAPTTSHRYGIQERFAETIRAACQQENPAIQYIGIGVRNALHVAPPRLIALPAPATAAPALAPRGFENIPRNVLAAVADYLARAERDGEPEAAMAKLLELCAPSDPQRFGEIHRIQIAVCQHYGITRFDMISSRRTWRVVQPRQVAMYLAKTLTLMSLPQIGRQFGKRDHTTVLHACRKIEALRQTDEDVSRVVDILLRQLERPNEEGNHETIGAFVDHQHDRDHSRPQGPDRL